jgi:peptidoglycan hydrolase-like protein with peptidoglycan-binding domain
MKRILLATVAAAALSFPAFAAPNHMQNKQQNQQMQQMQQNKLGSANYQRQAQARRIRPSQLNKKQIKQLQTSLNKKGLDAGHVDGMWGPMTATAVRNFQKKQNINANGHLTRQTLAALGVNVQGQSQAQNQQPSKKGTVGAAPSETTGQGSSMDTNSHKSQNMSQPKATTGQGSSMNQSNKNSDQMKPNANSTNSNSNSSGNMGKSKQ